MSNTCIALDHEEIIKCPNCGKIQRATVCHTFPWYSYVHDCEKCSYIIMESEWEKEPFFDHVADHVKIGCIDKTDSLGICNMPDGYALMLDADHMYFYWLRHDGVESVVCWDKWAVYRGAKKDSMERLSK